MPVWSDEFKDHLTAINEPYAPMFRLTMGGAGVRGLHYGTWERDNQVTLELMTHPGTSAYAGPSDSPVTGSRSGALSEPVRYGVGLTGRIQMGAQSVQPRTWIYTGPTLSVGVTQWAASKAMAMPQGVLCKLEIKLMSMHDEAYATVGGSQGWETIHYGMFKGVSWSGTEYTMNLACALDLAKSNSTREGVSIGLDYSWFAGLSPQAWKSFSNPRSLRRTETDFTSGASYEVQIASFAIDDLAWGRTSKKKNAFGGVAHHIGGSYAFWDGTTATEFQCWCAVTNHDSKKTFIRYEFALPTADPNYMALTGCTSENDFGMPGFFDLHAGASAVGGLGAGSSLQPVCVLHGTPVTEFVNTVYVQGYHEQMVPGIFGSSWTSFNDGLNVPDIEEAHAKFNSMYKYALAIDPINDDNPFRSVQKTEQSDGLSLMKKLCGKWGVFPRFKGGGYGLAVLDGLGVTLKDYSGTPHPVRGGTTATTNYADRMIRVRDIEGASIKSQATGTEGGFTGIVFSTSDADVHKTGSYPTQYGDSNISGLIASAPRYKGLPQMTFCSVKTDDVAAGIGDIGGADPKWGWRYAGYFAAYLYKDFWATNRIECEIRLRGLKFAGLAPGDFIHVHIPHSIDGVYPWSPYDAREQSIELHPSLLDTTGYAARGLGANSLSVKDIEKYERPWLVQSSQVDWVGATVTVTMSRPFQPLYVLSTGFAGDDLAPDVDELGIVFEHPCDDAFTDD